MDNNGNIQYTTILDSIFYKQNTTYVGIIKNTKNIPELLSMLYNQTDSLLLQSLLLELTSIIQNCPYTASILLSFTIESINNDMTLPKILLLLYFQWAKDHKVQQSIHYLLELLFAHCFIHHSIYETIYQSLSIKYYHPPIELRPVLDKNDYYLHERILSFLFKFNNIKKSSYIYFTGKEKLFIDFGLNEIKTNQNGTQFQLSDGFCAVFWIFNQYSYNELCSIDNNNQSKSLMRNIFDLQLTQGRIQLKSLNIHKIELAINNNIQKSFCSLYIQQRQWYQFIIKIYKNLNSSSSYPCVWLQISDSNKSDVYKTGEIKALSLKENLRSISFYENHIGMAQSIMCFSNGFPNETNILPFNFGNYSMRDYSESLNKFSSNSNKYIYYIPQNILNTILVAYSPNYFTENSKRYILEDLSPNNIMALIDLSSAYSSGINYCYSNFNELITSMSNLLPLFELITMNDNLLNDINIIISFFDLVSYLLALLPYEIIESNKNLALIDEFFSVLGLFMKNISIKLYTTEFFDYLIEYGKNIFKKCNSNQYKKYFSNVIMTQLINHSNNTDIWNNFIKSSNFHTILNHISILDLCALLKELDLFNSKIGCCINHSRIIKSVTLDNKKDNQDKDTIHSSSDLNERIEPIIKIIQMKIMTQKEMNNMHITLLSALIHDYSPCIHKTFINIFFQFFNRKENDNNSDFVKSETLILLLRSKGIEIILIAFSNATNDIKYNILQLIILLDTKYNNEIKKYIHEFYKKDRYIDTIFEFIQETIIMKIPCSSVNSRHSSIDDDIVLSNKSSIIESLNNDKFNINIKEEYELISYRKNTQKSLNSKTVQSKKNSQIDSNKLYFDNEDKFQESSIKDSNNIISNRKGSKESKISKTNSNNSSNITNNDKLRIKTDFLEVNNLNQSSLLINIFSSLISWLNQIIDTRYENESKINGVIKCIIKLLTETKREDLIMIFIKTLIAINDDKSKVYIVISNIDLYHYLNETLFHFYLRLLNIPIFESCFIDPKPNETKAIEEIYNNISKLINNINKTNYIAETLIPQLKYLNNWSMYNRKIFCRNRETELFVDYLDKYLSMIFSPIIQLSYNIETLDFTYGFTNYLTLVNSIYVFITTHFFMNYINNKLEPIFISYKNPIILPYIYHKYNYNSNYIINDNDEKNKSKCTKWPFYNIFLTIYNHHKQIWNSLISVDNNKNDNMNNYLTLLDTSNLNKIEITIKDKYWYLSVKVNNNNPFSIFLIKIISHFLVITITLSNKENDECRKWIKEYESFIIFCLLLEIILIKSNQGIEKDENSISIIIQEILSFSIVFLFKNSIKNNDLSYCFQESCSVILFLLCSIHNIGFTNNNNYLNIKHSFKDIIILNKNDNEKILLCQLLSICKSNCKLSDIIEYINLNREQLLNMFDSNRILNHLYNKFFNQKEYEELLKNQNSNENKIALYYNNIQRNIDSMMIIDSESISKRYLNFKSHIEKEVSKFSKNILMLISNFFLQIEINNRERMNLYKNIKKTLFSWNGYWSNYSLFFTQSSVLKYKFYNHYTNEYTKPILMPILDFETYFPKFSKYDPKFLFQNEYKHNVNLNVCKIFKEGDSINRIRNIKEYLKEKENTKRDKIMSYNYPSLYIDIIQLTSNSNNKRISCCLIKITQHIKGFFHLGNERIEFDNIEWDNDVKPSIIFDTKRNSCFSSFKENKLKYSHMPQKRIKYEDIFLLIKTRYCYLNSGMHIFTKTHKSYLFKFNLSEDRDNQFDILLDKNKSLKSFLKINNHHIAYCHNTFPYSSFNDFLIKWEKNKTSTIEYLMILNLLSSRSFYDLSQYPIFPWTLNNYSINPIDKSTLRDFGLPIGMIVLNNFKGSLKRKEDYLRKYEDKKKSNKEGNELYYFGSNYSNHLYTTHYLTRIFPFPQIMIEIQNNSFDNPNRMFLSIESSFKCVSTQNGDLRELIPEMFYLPEMFVNINNLNVGKVTCISKMEMFNHVDMPSWCNKNPYEFVAGLRENLEKICGISINKWIDIIFGIRQRGNKAKEICNVFMPYAYENNIQLNTITDNDLRMYLLGLYDLGVIPSQILYSKANPRNQIFDESIMSLKELIEVNIDIIFQDNHKAIAMFPIRNALDNNDNEYVIIFDDFGMKFINKIKSNHLFKYSIGCDRSNNHIPLLFKSQFIFKDINHQKYPIGIFNNNYIVIGGFLDGHLLVMKIRHSKENSHSTHFITENNNSLITHIEIDQIDNLVICGTNIGNIVIYQIIENSLNYFFTLYNHKKRITSLSLDLILNLFASSSIDGFIYLYIVPSFIIIRVFHIDYSFPDYVFLSSSPLPCLTYYSNSTSKFYCYSINGNFITELAESNNEGKKNILVTPFVFKNCYGFDYLVYFTIRGVLKIRKFPMMSLHENKITKEKKSIKILSFTDSLESLFVIV